MSVMKVLEIMVESEKSWEDATAKAIAKASETVKDIRSAYVQEQSVNTIKLSGLAAPKIKRRPRNNFEIILRQKNRAKNTKNNRILAIPYWATNYQGYRKKHL